MPTDESKEIDVTLDGLWVITALSSNDLPKIGHVVRLDGQTYPGCLPGWGKVFAHANRLCHSGVVHEAHVLGAVIADAPTRLDPNPDDPDDPIVIEQRNYGIDEKWLEACVRQCSMESLMRAGERARFDLLSKQ